MSAGAYSRPVTTETLAARAGLRLVTAPVAARIDPPVAVTLLWVPLVLLLDRGAGIWEQRALGVGTWLLRVLLLRRETPLVRAQVAVVVVFATAVEYTFSPFLEVYVYRLGNVPAFVPPGHGLVYLCALAIGRTAWVHRHRIGLRTTVVVGGGGGGRRRGRRGRPGRRRDRTSRSPRRRPRAGCRCSPGRSGRASTTPTPRPRCRPPRGR